MKRVCARQRSQEQGSAVRPAKGVWPTKGEPMTSRKTPPGDTGGRNHGHAASVAGARRALPPPASRRLRDSFSVPALPGISIAFHGSVGVSAEVARVNAARLHDALALLSQSETGRHLLRDLAKSGYGVCFDNKKTDAAGAIGLCDPHAKRLIMRSSIDSDELALFLAHEAVHALQNERSDDLLPSAHHKPETLFRLSFAIEADAYAQQTQIAFELAQGQTPRHRPLLLMRGRFPGLVRAGERALQAARVSDRDGGAKALDDGRVMAAVFNAFYDDAGLRSFYETSHLQWINEFAEKHAAQTAKKSTAISQAFNGRAGVADMFRKDMSSSRLKRLLQWRGQSYLQTHRPDIQFAEPRYAGLSPTILQGVIAFYQAWLPERRLPTLSTFGLALAHDNPPTPPVLSPRDALAAHQSRPVKAPRKRKRDFW